MPEFDAKYYLFSSDLGGGILLDASVYLVSIASMIYWGAHENSGHRRTW